jgi:DNA-binding transcriptional MerR regulator
MNSTNFENLTIDKNNSLYDAWLVCKQSPLLHKILISISKDKIFSLKHLVNISYRKVNHWTEKGLLNDTRTNGNGWRKFTYLEYIWIHIINELRNFGFPNNKILNFKKKLFRKKTNLVLEFYIFHTIIDNNPINLIIFQNGDSVLASQTDLEKKLSQGEYTQNYISININKIMADLYRDPAKMPGYIYPTGKEKKVINMVRTGKYNLIELFINNTEIKMLKTQEIVDLDKKIIDIIKQDAFQDIEVKVENNKTSTILKKTKYKL